MHSLQHSDRKIFNYIEQEKKRQKECLELIPSENYVSAAVQEAIGSILTNKYSEGYPNKRYYQGNKIVDEIETVTINRAKTLFKVPHVNVQAYSGSPANSAVYFALLKPGDTIMGLKLSAGGHLTHGHPDVTFSGTFYHSAQYDVDENGFIDMDQMEVFAKEVKPKIIVVGTTAYPRIFDWKRWRAIADNVGAYLLADISHIVGLVIGGVHPSPIPFADVIMTTTHKTLRGPRGAMILVTNQGLKKDPKMGERIDRAVFPGLQGGPHDNITAALAVSLEEASRPTFTRYIRQIVTNAKTLASELMKNGIVLTTGGTDNHLMVLDLRPQGIIGNVAAEALEKANIVVNRNSVPHDPNPPFYPSGIRLGTPAVTTRGMKEKEMRRIAKWIVEIIKHIDSYKLPDDKTKRAEFMKNVKQKMATDPFYKKIAKDVIALTKNYPVPGIS